MERNSLEPRKEQVRDLEIKDAQLIFESVWEILEKEVGHQNLRFPKEIFWLNGAPGAGKGTHTRFIMENRSFTAAPVVVSDLLQSAEAQKRKDAGLLVGDKEVTELVFKKLLEPEYVTGAIVDGYPRTKVQVECVKLFHRKLNKLRAESLQTGALKTFNKPQFHIIVLFVTEEESIKRQLKRGMLALEHNKKVEESGVGELVEIRKTDLEEEAARGRYRIFKEQTYDSLKSLREVFHYHFINAHGTLAEVQQRIIEELKYQSSLELDERTNDRLSVIPLASEIVKHARQELVKRLEFYEQEHAGLFKIVTEQIQHKFMPIVLRHAITGQAYVNTEEEVFHSPLALAMVIDIFSERGYHATVDIRREEIPDSFNLETFKIINRIKKVFRVSVRFSGCDIRRGGR